MTVVFLVWSGPLGNWIRKPNGPFHTKNSMESEFGTGSKFRYGDQKTLWRGLRNACFPKEKEQKNGTDCKRLESVAKYYGFERRSIFSTEGSFGERV